MNWQKMTFCGGLLSVPLLSILLQPAPTYCQVPESAALIRVDQTVALLRGRQIYERACVACHGISGDGNGPAAKYLDPRPRVFTSGTYKFRSTPSGQLPTDEDLFRTVTSGIPRTMMPAWRDLLIEQDRRDVVAYIKTFSDKFEQSGPGTPIQIDEEPRVTPQSISEGKSLYIIMECWVCHGAGGKGDGGSSNTLKDDWGHKIKPFNFTLGNYKGGKKNRSVYKTFNTGLNGTPMPSYAETFLFGGDSIGDLSSYREAYSASEVAALQAYLDTQPSEEKMGAMSDAELEKLINRRRWSLVHFVKSLSRKESLFYRLLVEDTEVTK